MNVNAILNEFNDTLLFEYNCDSACLEFSPTPPAVLGLPDWLPLQSTAGERALSEAADKLRHVMQTAQSDGSVVKKELTFLARDGEPRFYLCLCKALESESHTRTIVGKLTDITDRFDHEQDLLRRANMDVLTGLYNRSAEALIAEQLSTAKGGTLFMLDLDDFKRINDSYGHGLGDRVLVEVGHLLRRLFRPNDIIARVGGDEFIVFIKGEAQAALAEKRAQLILDELKALYVPGVDIPLGMCIGIALSPPLPAIYQRLHKAADFAMYEGKHTGKRCWRLYSELQ